MDICLYICMYVCIDVFGDYVICLDVHQRVVCRWLGIYVCRLIGMYE